MLLGAGTPGAAPRLSLSRCPAPSWAKRGIVCVCVCVRARACVCARQRPAVKAADGDEQVVHQSQRHACMCVCARACPSACACVRARACVYASVSVHSVRTWMRARPLAARAPRRFRPRPVSEAASEPPTSHVRMGDASASTGRIRGHARAAARAPLRHRRRPRAARMLKALNAQANFDQLTLIRRL